MLKYSLLTILTLIALTGLAQDSKPAFDTTKHTTIPEIVVSASRVPESILRSPISIMKLNSRDIKNLGAINSFDALGGLTGVHVIIPGLGFQIINTRGFANTTNVRFSQLVDGIDNQAPHIGAPIANALGASELDIDAIEIIPGTASALYGMNAINGLANIKTKNPFTSEGLSIRQLTGVNHIGNIDSYGPEVYSETNIRFAKKVNKYFAFKVNGAITKGRDWVANNTTDLAPTINSSVGLTGANNPAYDEVNSYGNESSDRRTLTLNGKKYVVARTGYRETDIDDYNLQNYKGDLGLYIRPKESHELSITYKGALINSLYQRSNRFRLKDYVLNQFTIDYHTSIFEFRTYLTQENTGHSYNIRSLAENMDKNFKSDDNWYAGFTSAYNNAINGGSNIASAMKIARQATDNGRYIPGTATWNKVSDSLVNINNWDYGAALRVQSYLYHAEGLLHWDKLFPSLNKMPGIQLLSGFDYRTYIIVPDGNYFINPVDTGKNLTYSKIGGFTQINKDLFDKKIRLGATIRADYGEYFDWKINPRITCVYTPKETINFRASYQSGYRFPSIFEGFSNVISGGVKRVGGLKIMSNGVFENSYTKASIDAFQAKVNTDVNTGGLTLTQAINQEKSMIKKNPYTYLQPEYVRATEFGFRGLALNKLLFIDADFYYNSYDNFIAQVEASTPKNTNPDSLATSMYTISKQNRYRLWTNSKSKINTFGASLGLRYKISKKFTWTGNLSWSQLDKTDNRDGLEDGFNTPNFIYKTTLITESIWKHLGASITYRYQTQYDYVSFLVNGTVPSYWTLDAQVNYQFTKPGITTKLGATNLLNKTYYTMLGGSEIGGLYYLSLTYDLFKRDESN